jgi:DNA polymerase-4
MPNLLRKIIHIDMDAFFAAIEQRDNSDYRNKPIIVGGQPESRGVVATCSYEARQFGIRSAMPSAYAYRLCPQAIFVKPRFSVYQETSEIIRHIFSRYCEIFEPVALDEAYLDVTCTNFYQGSATLLAKQLKQEIYQQTQLIASAGISYNKFLAKIASDIDKPNGLYLIKPNQGAKFVESLAIGQFHGVGPSTEKRMHQLGIYTGKDLKQVPLHILQQEFGKSAQFFFEMARGHDQRSVNGLRTRKSFGMETTFQEDINDPLIITQYLQLLLQQLLIKLSFRNLQAFTLTIKIKFQNFVQITRGRTLLKPISNCPEIHLLIADLLKEADLGKRKVRLLGVTLSSLQAKDYHHIRQMDIFETD